MTAFNREVFGGTAIYRPTLESELAVRQEAEAALRKDVASGTYAKKDEINAILQKHFAFFEDMLKKALSHIASFEVMQFVLKQYDISCEIDTKYRNAEIVDLNERKKWRELGRIFRRAAKYLAECITMLAPTNPLSVKPEQVVELIDRCWICSEQMVSLSILSTQTFALFPAETTLEIRPEGELVYFELLLKDPSGFIEFDERIRRDTESRRNVINEEKMIYNESRMKRILDEPFKSSCGFSIDEVFQFGFGISRNSDGRGVQFYPEFQILETIQRSFDVSAAEAKCMFDGLALRRDAMLKEDRVVWRPKQEYRAGTRPFFEFPHSLGTHFIWSRSMASECLMMLYTRLVQKHVPPEWAIGTVPKAIEDYASAITKEFETNAISCLGQHGITAGRFKSSIGRGAAALKIPDLVGELDLLGYWEQENLLVVGECKLVKPTHEPSTFRDDISKFTGGSNNYVTQVQRKAKWVFDNAPQVAAALQSINGFPATVTAKQVAPVLVTCYPAFASLFISDVPCVALTELVSDLRRANAWPYSQVQDVGTQDGQGGDV